MVFSVKESSPEMGHFQPIAVIIPLFNGAPWIQEAIDSVLAQDLMPKEIVVVDDGSTDNSPELVCTYPQVKLLRNPGKGSCIARNFGLTNTHSPFVAFLDQDDVWHPAHLRLLVHTLQKYPEANTVFSTSSVFEKGLPEYQIPPIKVIPFDPWIRFPFTIGVDGPSLVLIRRTTLEAIGLWEEKSTGMGDALLFLKLATLHPLLQLSSSTVGKRVHAGAQWLRVRAWGSSYLSFRFEVMRLALNFRQKQQPSDPSLATFEQRLKALRTLRQLTLAIETETLVELSMIGRQLEHELNGEPQNYLRHAFYCLMGALFPIHDSERLRVERDRVFMILLEAWPKDASQTRAALQSMIGETPKVS